jgi:hypothetical protein
MTLEAHDNHRSAAGPQNSGPASSQARTVIRDAGWVQREYGTEKWPGILRGLEELTQRERRPLSLARVVGQLTRQELTLGGRATRVEEMVVGGQRVRLPAGAALAAEQGLVVEAVLDAVTPRTEAIVELGSGWGHNLFRLWLEGGPPQARYVAAEYTEAGHEVARRIGELEAGMRLETHPFDYHNPRGFSLGKLDEVVVFTVNSIEQIPHLSQEVVRTVCELGTRVRCLHFEPVGWQVDPDSSSSSSEYAERHDYNRNLVSLLRSAAAEGTIELDDPQPEIIGTNPHNATTLLTWSTAVAGLHEVDRR